MSTADILRVASSGYKKLIGEFKDSCEQLALEKRDTSLDRIQAIYCVKKIADSRFEAFKVRFTAEYHSSERDLEMIYYRLGKNALFNTSHLTHLVEIVLGLADPGPKESVPLSGTLDKA